MNPTFKIMTGAMTPYIKDVNGVQRKALKATASSSVRDRHGDEILPEVIQSMAKQVADTSMTIFLNHSYEVPEDVFGTTTAAVSVQRGFDKDGAPVWDMDLDVVLNEANPRAIQVWDGMNDNGVRFGVSIGALITDWEPINQKAGPFGGLRIKGLDPLEASIVGIPANPRSWVQNASKAVKAFLVKAASCPECGGTSGKHKPGCDDAEKGITNVELIDSGAGTLTASGEPVPDGDLAQLLGVDTDTGDTDGDAPAEPGSGDPTHGNALDSSEPSTPPAGDEPASDSQTSDATTVDAGEPAATDTADGDSGATQPDPIQDSLALTLSATASGAIDLLVKGYKAELARKDAEITQITKERDEAREALSIAKAIVEQIASLPLGRKTSFANQVSTFRRDLSGVYGEDFLRILERTPTE